MYICERRTLVRDACLREMNDELPVLQAILEGGAGEVDTDDVATH
jgi:hypothetical protein